jgi:hypothetical protein
MKIPYAHDEGSTIIVVGLQVEKMMQEDYFQWPHDERCCKERMH